MLIGTGGIGRRKLPTCNNSSPVSEKDFRRARGTVGIPRIVGEHGK